MSLKQFATRLKLGCEYLVKRNYYSLRRGAIWPEGEYKRGLLKRIQRIYNYKYFVETGTCLGETPAKLSGLFERIWTIELSEELFQRAKINLSKYKNVTCLHGNSGQILSDVVRNLDAPTLFWLDGHFSGGVTASGENPIIEELNVIKSSSINNHVIVIDDMSDFSLFEKNAPLSAVVYAIENINPNYKFYSDYDMLFALPFEREHREFWRKAVFPLVIR